MKLDSSKKGLEDWRAGGEAQVIKHLPSKQFQKKGEWTSRIVTAIYCESSFKPFPLH
jgi:hypothetical protein